MMFLRSSILRYAQLPLAAVSVLLPFAVDAFVGHHRNVFNSHVAFQRTRRNRGPESLSMNLFDRFSRVAKANIDSVLQKIEDPEKVMTQAVEDMQVRINLLRYRNTSFIIKRHDSLYTV